MLPLTKCISLSPSCNSSMMSFLVRGMFARYSHVGNREVWELATISIFACQLWLLRCHFKRVDVSGVPASFPVALQ